MVGADTTVGVPLMVPVDVSKERPVGSDGEIDQLTTVPPPTEGVAEVMVVPFVSVNGLPL